MSMSENTLITTEAISPGVVALTLARPEKRNALSIAVMQQLCAAVEQTEADVANRVIILRGDGPVFCAGLDLAEAADEQNVPRSAQLVARSLKTLNQSQLISIAAVHGAVQPHAGFYGGMFSHGHVAHVF